GTIKEMKQHIKKSSIKLELDGDVTAFCDRLRSIEDIVDFERRGDCTVELSFAPNVPILRIVQDVLSIVSNEGLDLLSINSSIDSIEDAFLTLLEEEESRGFLRAVEP
ncbi:MAG: hypothetical protein KAR03_10760, partial [Candidatus Thorarchaeota archaeon]|nr:hypothetical protein [Candidatus Thorarchaeota archaeon]